MSVVGFDNATVSIFQNRILADFFYPRDNAIKFMDLVVYDHGKLHQLHVSFDFQRNGWQLDRRHGDGWKEAFFVQAYARRKSIEEREAEWQEKGRPPSVRTGPPEIDLPANAFELNVILETLLIFIDDPSKTKANYVQFNLVDVRGVDDVLVKFDFERGGWSILQASCFEWDADDVDCDSDWQEVAFITFSES